MTESRASRGFVGGIEARRRCSGKLALWDHVAEESQKKERGKGRENAQQRGQSESKTGLSQKASDLGFAKPKQTQPGGKREELRG